MKRGVGISWEGFFLPGCTYTFPTLQSSPHTSVVPYLDDGHPRDDGGRVLDGGAVDGVVGPDDQNHVRVLELGVDLIVE